VHFHPPQGLFVGLCGTPNPRGHKMEVMLFRNNGCG